MTTIPSTTLSNFIDFCSTSGPRQAAFVRAAMSYVREYDFHKDFYAPLRMKIVSDLKYSRFDLPSLRSPHIWADRRRVSSYKEVISGLHQWLHSLGSPIYIDPTMARGDWTGGSLSVRANPEIALNVSGLNLYIKLYYKERPLEQSGIESCLQLMREVMTSAACSGSPAILDCRRGTLFTPDRRRKNVELYLRAQVQTYSFLWNGISAAA